MPKIYSEHVIFLTKVNTMIWPILSAPRPKKNNGGNALFGGEATNFVDPAPTTCPWLLETTISINFNNIDQIPIVIPLQT